MQEDAAESCSCGAVGSALTQGNAEEDCAWSHIGFNQIIAWVFPELGFSNILLSDARWLWYPQTPKGFSDLRERDISCPRKAARKSRSKMRLDRVTGREVDRKSGGARKVGWWYSPYLNTTLGPTGSPECP